MFFARLAVAALSFGSFAKVFAAPIAVDGLSVPVSENLPAQRRADLDFNTVLADAVNNLANVKSQVAALTADPTAAVKPELTDALAQVAPALATISSSLKATGAEELAKLSTDSVAANMAIVLDSVNVIVTSVEGIKTVKLVGVALGNIKGEVETVVVTVAGVLPLVFELLKTVLETLNAALKLVFGTVSPAIASLLSGGL